MPESPLPLTDMRNRDAEGNPMSETFYSSEGLKEFVQYIDSNKESLINDVIDTQCRASGHSGRSGFHLQQQHIQREYLFFR